MKKNSKKLHESIAKSNENETLVITFQNEINRLQTEVEEKGLEINTLKMAFESQKELLGVKEQEIQGVMVEVKKLREEKEDVSKCVEESLRNKKEFEKKIAGLEAERNSVSLNSRLEKDLIRNELNEEIENLKELVEKLQEEYYLVRIKEKNEQLESKESEKHENIGQAKIMVNKKKQKLRSVKEKVAGLQENVNETVQEVERLKETITKLENTLQLAQSEESSLKATISNLENTIESLHREENSLKEK